MYKCQCGIEYEKVGAYNLHNYHCRLKAGNVSHETKSKLEGKGAGGSAPPSNECEHSWALLGNSGIHKIARAQGYHKYCRECEELE